MCFGSDAAASGHAVLTGLVTRLQTEGGWVVERKDDNAPLPLPLFLLCARKVFKADVKYLAPSEHSFIQKRSPGRPLSGRCPLPPRPSQHPPLPWDQRRRRGWGGHGGSSSSPGMMSQRYGLGRETHAALWSIPESGMTVSFHALVHCPDFCIGSGFPKCRGVGGRWLGALGPPTGLDTRFTEPWAGEPVVC